MAFNVQFKRSSILEKRPVAAYMLEGEINLNVNPDSTGLFFKDTDGNVVKVGPAHMGPTSPNAVPDPNGSVGNTIGEFWYDTQNSLLKIFDGINFIAVESGEVRTVSGVGAISVDSSDAENPVISVAAASTSAAGVVQLVDNTSSTSTTQALTANQGKVLQDQINSLSLSSNITLGGTFDPATGLMVTVTATGSNQGFIVGQAIPSAVNNSEVFIISEGYSADFTAPGGSSQMYHVGDWLLSDGSVWNFLDVGHQPASATDSYAGVVELATDAETQAGVDSTIAVTPASLQSKVSDSNSLNSSTTLASSQALSTERDERIAADGALQTSINNEASRAQLAEAGLANDIQAEEDRALAAEAAIVLAAGAEETRALAAESDLQDAIDGEITRATAAETSLTSNLASETNRAILAEGSLDARVYAIEENLNTSVTTIFEGDSAVIADGAAPSRDPNYKEGWNYINAAGEKINWYFYDGSANPSTFDSASFYAVVTLNSTTLGDTPFFSVYSAATGVGDASSWYKSRKTYHIENPSLLTAGKKYLMYFGADPQVNPELERVPLTVDTYSSVGTQAGNEALFTAAFSSNSGSSAGAVNFLAESLGFLTQEGGDLKAELRFRKASLEEMEAADAAIQTVAYSAIPKATITAKGDLIVGTGDSSYVSVGAGSDGQILMADSSAVSGLGWFTTDAGTY